MTDDRSGQPVLLWGSTRAGKSGVLGALYDLGLASNGEGWSLSPGDAEPAVTEQLVNLRNALLERAPRPTAPQSHYAPLDITIRKRKNGRTIGRLPLSFVDPAGEFADNVQRLRDSGAELLQRMLDARGVIWLFDASNPNADHDAIFGQLTTLTGMTGGDLVKTPVALCLSKIDLLGEDAMQAALKNPADALCKHIGGEIFHLFSRVFESRQCFAISSCGRIPGAIQPIGLNAVFDWIHERDRLHDRIAALKQQRRAFVRALLGVAVLALSGWGAVEATDRVIDNRRERELETLGRLERAGAEYKSGNNESAVILLSGRRLGSDHPRALEWDTLYAFAALELGLRLRNISTDGDSLLTEVISHASRALEHPALTDVDAISRLRFARARACMALECARGRQRFDLEYVAENTTNSALRRRARQALQELQ